MGMRGEGGSWVRQVGVGQLPPKCMGPTPAQCAEYAPKTTPHRSPKTLEIVVVKHRCFQHAMLSWQYWSMFAHSWAQAAPKYAMHHVGPKLKLGPNQPQVEATLYAL